MSEALPKLYAIIDRETLDARGLQVAQFARDLRDAGVRLVQYRDKIGSPQEILRACEQVRGAFEGSGAKLILNDRPDLALLGGFHGVHVGQGDLPVGAVRKVLHAYPETHSDDTNRGRQFIVGLSTHSDDQVRAANNSDPDYVAIGPVFATSTKSDTEPVVGLEGVRRARSLTSKPLVAIGGITLENAASVRQAGADAVALIGGLVPRQGSVGAIAKEFLQVLS